MALIDLDNLVHVLELLKMPMHAFCVYIPGGEIGAEEYEGFDAGGFCKNFSLRAERWNAQNFVTL